MNEHDRANLEFLLNAFSQELREQAQALKIEAEMSLSDNYHEANMVIDRIRKL